jgi:hypothetical protein
MYAARRRRRDACRSVVAIAASVLAGIAALAGATSALAIAPYAKFEYTGTEQQYTVPGGVTLLAVGAQGGYGGGENSNVQGAEGAGFLPVSAGQGFYVEVGGEGKYASTEAAFGGGGPGGTPPPGYCVDNNHQPCAHTFASSGGGASDVRTIAAGQPGSLSSRVIVAAGGGGTGGGGMSMLSSCGTGPGGGRGAFAEPLPQGNAAAGPLPIKIASGLVVPGLYSAGLGGGNPGDRSRQEIDGFLDAGPGTDLGGLPGEASGCTEQKGPEETGTFFESLPGFEGTEGQGGSGGNAATLPPSKTRHCYELENACVNAGAGGGGGGGYFGGGGGATGYNACTLTKQECNAATPGQGGAGGSSFFANEVLYPQIQGATSGVAHGLVTLVPVIEITSPASGANYAPGAVVNASWECLTGPTVNGVPQIGTCKGTKASGEAIDTSKGVHTFTISARTRVEGEEEPISSTITYTALEAPTVTKVKPASGPNGGGTLVTITGTNFEDVTAVHFGALHAQKFKVNSATSLTAVSPAGSVGAVDITVTTGGGTSALSKADLFKFAPTVNGVSPNEGPAAGGTKVTISGTGFATAPGATVIRFATTKATAVSCSSSTSCEATAPAHAAGTVDVKVTVNKVTSAKSAPADQFTYH